MPFPFLIPAELQDPKQPGSNLSSQPPGANSDAAAEPERVTEQLIADAQPEVFAADWDEELLFANGSDDEDEWEAEEEAMASWQQQRQQPGGISSAECRAATAVADRVMPGLAPVAPTAVASAKISHAAEVLSAAAGGAATAGAPVAAHGPIVEADGGGRSNKQSPRKCSPPATSPASPGGRLQQSAAAGVALCVAMELCNNDALDSEDENVEGRQQKRRRTAATPAVSDDSYRQQDDDVEMADAETVVKGPSAIKQQRQQP